MSEFFELVDRLCPDGVEYVNFLEVAEYVRGITYSKGDESKEQNGIPVLRANNITLDYNTLNFDDVKFVLPSVRVKPSQFLQKDDVLICAGSGSKEHIGKVAYVKSNTNYAFGGFMAVIRTKNPEILLPRFIFHILTSINFREHIEKAINSTTINNLNTQVMASFKIPLPPLVVQREVVGILDLFTGLTAELTAELELRKKQYAYYREVLLSFDEKSPSVIKEMTKRLCPNGIEYKTLGEVAEIGTGSSNTNEGLKEGNYPFYVRSQEPLRKNEYEFNETAIITAGDGVGVGKVFHYVEGKYALHQRAYRIVFNTPEVLPKFYYYYMQSAFPSYIKRIVYQGSVASIRRSMLTDFSIPLPPLEIQHKIVEILDKFDTLTTSLTEGIPAEIEARRKQYTYYRNKLLTFKEKQ